MKPNAEAASEAIAAIYQLRHRIKQGDREAVAALRDVALFAIAQLDTFATVPADHPELPEALREGAAAVQDVAADSLRWPVQWDSIKEIREPHLARVARLGIGTAAGIRLTGKARGFTYNEHTGFALDVFLQLEAIRKDSVRHVHPADLHPELDAPGVLTDEQRKRDWRNLAALLQPLDGTTRPKWTEAGVELCRDWCQGDWNRFPWTGCVARKAGTVTDDNGHERTTESAVRQKISDGLAKLIP